MEANDDRLQTRPARELFSELRQLHVSAGEPSSRSIAESIGGMSHTTVNQVMRSRRIPSWPVLAKIVKQLGGDEISFRILWNSTRDGGVPIDDLPAPATTGHDVSVFVSYAHVDDRATYQRVRHFVEDVGNTYESMTGQEVGLFLDRSSIAPGEDWKDRIKLGLSSSSIFLAFISPAYIRSVNCTQEFWEYVHFLNANSTTRLLVPLLFADETRMKDQFGEDPLWIESSRLQRIDISKLRFEPLGSSQWLQHVQGVATTIEAVLHDVAGQTGDRPEMIHGSEDATTLPKNNIDLLGKIAKVEEAVPATTEKMETLTDIMNRFGGHIRSAGPMMTRATTTKRKISISRQLGKQLDPIADDMVEVANAIHEIMILWDSTVRAIIEFGRVYPNWLQDEEVRRGVDAIAQMADVGIESFAELDNISNMFGQGRGLAAALDDPLGKAQEALRVLTDVRGLFFGWREGLETLELS